MREVKLIGPHLGSDSHQGSEVRRKEHGEVFVVGEEAKELVDGAHITKRKPKHGGTQKVPHGPWQTKPADELAEVAWAEQIALGDRPVRDWRRKVAQLHAHPEISGTVAGVGVGDIVDRLHEGLDTANTLIRSFDLDDERFAAAEFGEAPSPTSMERAVSIAKKEISQLLDLGAAQLEQDLRKAPHHPLVKDRALFALGRAAAISKDGGEVWLALEFLPEPGSEPQAIMVHARLLGDDFRAKKAAIETLGINLLHAAYFHGPEDLAAALSEGLDPSAVEVDFIRSVDVSTQDPPPVRRYEESEPPRPEIGADRRALHKAEQLNNSGWCAGVVAEIGASQLVADVFRRAGGTNKALFERKSNYGMEMSAFAYGKVDRAVSKERLASMLDHELAQFSKRAGMLTDRKLFAYANTVATKPGGGGAGWLGIDFQTEPGGPTRRIMVHARMLSEHVPDQELALKTLGINLIHAAQLRLDPSSAGQHGFIRDLMDGVPPGSLSIDHIEQTVPTWSDDSMRIGLLRRGLSDALLFTKTGERKTTLDHFYRREYIVRRDRDVGDANLVHLDLSSFEKNGHVDEGRLLGRVKALNAEGRDVILTRRPELRDLLSILAASANTHQTIVVTRSAMRRLLDPKQWIGVDGGMEGLLGKLLDIEKSPIELAVLPGNDSYEPKSAAAADLLARLRTKGVVRDLPPP